MRLISAPILLLAFPALSFVLGIIPGLLLGIFGWHEDGAWVLGIIYALGYRMQRQVKYGGIPWMYSRMACTLLLHASLGSAHAL